MRQDAHEQLKMRNQPSKEGFKQKEKITTSYLPFITWCHHTPMMKVTSQVSGHYLKKFSFNLAIHINKETNMFGLQLCLIQPD